MTKTRITPEKHLAEVLASYDDSPNERLAEITRSLVRHLHEFVVEVGLTRDEWFRAVEELARAGRLCGEERQEFALLSDTLGVSMLVEMVNHPGGGTEPTVFGPFHVDGAPRREMGESIVADVMDSDANLVVTGRVLDLDGNPIDGAELDVWETASNGFYDVQDDGQSEMNMRGIYTTGPDGRFEIHGVRPVDYTIPDDGPGGDLLFHNGRHSWRPAHFHFVVSAPGHRSVITHLFDSESNYIDGDAVFGVRDSLVVDMTNGTCEFDFVLVPEQPDV